FLWRGDLGASFPDRLRRLAWRRRIRAQRGHDRRRLFRVVTRQHEGFGMTATLTGFGALFALLFTGMPLAFGMAIVGFVGFALTVGINPAGAMSAQIVWDNLSSYSLSVLPLFVLMGNLINHAGLSADLYNASNALIGHRKGGLAMATILASGGFAAVSGSSLATAATMSSIALPSMRRYRYHDSLSS